MMVICVAAATVHLHRRDCGLVMSRGLSLPLSPSFSLPPSLPVSLSLPPSLSLSLLPSLSLSPDVLSSLPHSAEWLQHSNSSIGLMSPMHHSSTSPLQSSGNIQAYISAIHPASIGGGSRTNTLAVRPSGLQRSVSLPLRREKTPPKLPGTTSEVVGNPEEDPVVLVRSSPMKEVEPDSTAVELEAPMFYYRRRGALRNRRAFSQEVPHLSPYFRPRNQSAGAASSAAGVHRAAVLGVSETTRATLDEEEEEEEMRPKEKEEEEEEEEEEPNPLVESVKHKLLEQGHLSLLDVVEKMPTTLHESIVTDNVSQSCLETITRRVPELQSGHLANSDADSSHGAIHWFEGEGSSACTLHGSLNFSVSIRNCGMYMVCYTHSLCSEYVTFW